jgi:hypothetical protein
MTLDIITTFAHSSAVCFFLWRAAIWISLRTPRGKRLAAVRLLADAAYQDRIADAKRDILKLRANELVALRLMYKIDRGCEPNEDASLPPCGRGAIAHTGAPASLAEVK